MSANDAAVLIRGAGIAANCCAHLLNQAGVKVNVEAVARPAVPAILLSETALALMRNVFSRPDLFAGKARIDRRVVFWGARDPVIVPHSAVVVSEDDLEAAFGNELSSAPGVANTFTIHTARPFPAGAPRSFGDRRATATQIHLKHPEDRSTCLIEAVEEGWLFLLPSAPDSGWLLAVGETAETLLRQSRQIAQRIVLSDRSSSAFMTSPRLHSPLQGGDWLACGTAAVSFDPICGDGSAMAVREAILASAVLVSMRDGDDSEALLAHYQSMLIATMRKHLRLCSTFYESGGRSDWWSKQLVAISEGFDWCSSELAAAPEPRYALQGFRLVLRDSVS